MNPTENNKIVDEFMGNQITDIDGNIKNDRELHYHTSWDWLMLVVEKIESLNHNEGKFDCGVEIYYERCSIIAWHGEVLVDYTGPSKLIATYNAVVLFIQWFNEQSK